MSDSATIEPRTPTPSAGEAPAPAKATTEEESRLAGILRDWGGLVHKVEGKKSAREAIVKFREWVAGADAPTVLRLTQVLLANAEVPGIHKRHACLQAMEKIDQTATVLGGQAEDIRYSQAVLLSVWPSEKLSMQLLVPLFFESAWALQQRPEEEADTILDWRKRNSTLVEGKLLDTDRLTELMWWGQAQYCHWLQRPYRRIADVNHILFYSAFEVAQRAHPHPKKSAGWSVLAMEPTASYLARHLQECHLNLDEKKPLFDWLAGIHLALSQQEGPPFAEDLKTLIAGDPLGLPVSWVRSLATSKAALPDLVMAQKQVCLDLKKEICLEEFAELLLRECMLDWFLEPSGV